MDDTGVQPEVHSGSGSCPQRRGARQRFRRQGQTRTLTAGRGENVASTSDRHMAAEPTSQENKLQGQRSRRAMGRGRRGRRWRSRGGHSDATLEAVGVAVTEVPRSEGGCSATSGQRLTLSEERSAGSTWTRDKQQDTSQGSTTKPTNSGQHLRESIVLGLNRGRYQCLICCQNMKRTTPIWACTTCYKVFHLSCIRQWFKSQPVPRSLVDPRIVSGISSSSPRPNTLRCPGCHTETECHEQMIPYVCWCGHLERPDPAPPGDVPHSCFAPCSKRRKNCEHPCPLQCHPGPCPPCVASNVQAKCFCGRQCREVVCGKLKPFSCGDICHALLSCGKHRCTKVCHPGICQPCIKTLTITCRCQKYKAAIPCPELQPDSIMIESQRNTIADDHDEFNVSYRTQYQCPMLCGFQYACGKHQCTMQCHDHSKTDAVGCPLSSVEYCACGKTRISPLYAACENWITEFPTCGKLCAGELRCGHVCLSLCHIGPHPPCTKKVTKRCRCGRGEVEVLCGSMSGTEKPANIENPFPALAVLQSETTKMVTSTQTNDIIARMFLGTVEALGEGEASKETVLQQQPHEKTTFLCTAICKRILSCGKHRCGSVCCDLLGVEHQCHRSCNKLLTCGKHYCDELCHAGDCRPCGVTYSAGWSCECGFTRLPPPYICGEPTPECYQPCSRGTRSCGHSCESRCHSDSCGPCYVLVMKPCACGRRVVQCPCKAESTEVSCNGPCPKVHPCGHPCRSRCGHPRTCPPCNAVCNSQRDSCEHGCQEVCHPDTKCPDIPCKVSLIATCQCGRQQSRIECGKFGGDGSGNSMVLECKSACIAARRLEALATSNLFGLEGRGGKDVYDEGLIDFCLKEQEAVKQVEEQINGALESNANLLNISCPTRTLSLMLDYVVQHYRLLPVSSNFQKNRHLIVDPELVRIPSPLLSVTSRGKPRFSELDSPTKTFMKGNVIRYAADTPRVIVYDVKNDVDTLTFILRVLGQQAVPLTGESTNEVIPLLSLLRLRSGDHSDIATASILAPCWHGKPSDRGLQLAWPLYSMPRQIIPFLVIQCLSNNVASQVHSAIRREIGTGQLMIPVDD